MDDYFLNKIQRAHQNCSSCPPRKEITSFFEELLGLLFPNFNSRPLNSLEKVETRFSELKKKLGTLTNDQSRDSKKSTAFFELLPQTYDRLNGDIDALFAGDPAAKNREEVIRSYPGFFAISAYRIAHELLKLEIDILPRSITEHAHSVTGIDIHPGATIGERFFIDHGTGVVIGETTVIGDDVKIYQGVTLGALSVEKILTKVKRHPTIGNRVIIYSGATILGGNTTIGDECIIGGNVWLTKSVSSGSKVYYKPTISNQEESDTNDSMTIKSI